MNINNILIWIYNRIKIFWEYILYTSMTYLYFIRVCMFYVVSIYLSTKSTIEYVLHNILMTLKCLMFFF